MNDLEICKRIAEIEGLIFCDRNRWVEIYNDLGCVCGYMDYDPLKDNALCFKLMVKYELQLTRISSGDYICNKQNVYVNINNTTKGVSTPSKAICLAIIEAHNE